MGKQAAIKFRAIDVSEIHLDLTSHVPDLHTQPLGVELFLNGERLCAFSLWRYGWLELRIPVPQNLVGAANGEFELELRTDRTWQPRPVAGETRDDRELSIAVCNIVVR
jgi:hypothetical protein